MEIKPVTGWGTALGNAASYVKYAAYDVHLAYFDKAKKAANILNKFWDRAVN